MISKTKISLGLVSLILNILTIIFLVGFYVFAWVEPGSNPPESNVPAPLNVSIDGQTKLGGLTLNDAGDPSTDALILKAGYLQLGYLGYPGPPGGGGIETCDDTTKGRMILDDVNNLLYICNGISRGWDYIPLTD